jgi:hypothetical protein
MDTPHGGIRIRFRWETVKLESIVSVLDPMVKRLELVALKRSLLAGVVELDDDAVFLDIGETKPFVRERRNERGSLGQFVEFIEESTPTDTERHTKELVGHAAKPCYGIHGSDGRTYR